MVARFQRFTTFFLLTGAALWLAACAVFRAPGWLYFGAAFVLFNHVIVLGLEFALLPFVHDRAAAPRATPSMLLRAWLAECFVSPTVFCWRQPFRSHLYADTLRDPLALASGMSPLVLVHGFGCNRGVWLPVLKRLQALGVPFTAINLEPMFGSIETYVGAIDAAVENAFVATGLPPIVLAHSMGGLAARAWFIGLQNPARVRRIITIGSPHQGTLLARFARGPNARQMRWRSEWLARLLERTPASAHPRFTCFYSNADNIVMPCSSALLSGADNRHVPGLAHIELAYAAEVFEETLRWCQRSDAASSAGKPANV